MKGKKHSRFYLEARQLALVLMIALPMICTTRLFGQEEDNVGYRKGIYQEDDNRMRVTTDNWEFDVGLRPDVRVSGDIVEDAITGATPTGAPPQNQWPFPSQAGLYQTAYKNVYTSQYSQFVSANQILVDGGVWTESQLTNYAAQYAGSQAPNIASNTAAAQFHSLTNNPNYHNNKVPLTHLHDFRFGFNLAVPITFGNNEITPAVAYSLESDYQSFGGSLDYARSFNQKNTTLNIGYQHDSDDVRDENFIYESKFTDNILVGLVQLFGPKAYLTVNATVSLERGYLSDPYRGVMWRTNFVQLNPDDAGLTPEKRPGYRNSEILYASWTQFITPANGSYEVSYRFFHDSYGIYANTLELDWHQKIGKQLVISPMFRYYIQNAADFYYVIAPDFDNKPAYYSSDYRLSEFESFAGGVTLSWRCWKYVSLEASYMRYAMVGLDGMTSQSAYPSANVYTFGLRGWF
ncbi:MAG TPA: DUF3570 domain-containing protein [Candidatus Sulfotelmatobacter sp.]|nr:DUF3570 domain-containing protein [Candidatus Sulfotelmatobacter sp.]